MAIIAQLDALKATALKTKEHQLSKLRIAGLNPGYRTP